MTDDPLNLSFDAIHDADAGVWVATSAAGRITTEAPSREALIERLKVIVPDVLESRLGHAPRDVSIVINWQELRTFEQTELMVAQVVADFSRDVRRILREGGCYFVRQGKGDHEIWYSPITNTTFPVDGKIVSRHSANGVLKSAGLPKAF